MNPIFPAIGALVAWILCVNLTISPQQLKRFAARQQIVVTPENGPWIISYLRHLRYWRSAGAAAGFALAGLDGAVGIEPFWLVSGWLVGALLAEVLRPLPKGASSTSAAILSPAAAVFCAMGTAGAAVTVIWTVVRSFSAEVTPLQRLSAVAAVVVAAATYYLIYRLKTAPLSQETAELATRSRSAHVLATGGGMVALWIAVSSGVMRAEPTGLLIGIPLMLIALYIGTRPFATHAPPRSARPVVAWSLTALGAAGMVISLALPTPQTGSYVTYSDDGKRSLTGPAAYAGRTECERSSRGCARWFVSTASDQLWLMDGDAEPGAPFALSMSGTRIAYRDVKAGTLLARDLLTAKTHPLYGDSPAFSPDGRHVATLTPAGVQLVDLQTGAGRAFPGLRRIIGLAPDSLVATTGPKEAPGAADVELVTVGFDGRERSRVPFDPTLDALLSPDAERLVIPADNAGLITMDTRSGKVLDRRTLKIEDFDERVTLSGWTQKGHLLIGIPQHALQRVDLATGKISSLDGEFPTGAVPGKVVA